MTVKQYNDYDMGKWHERVAEWMKDKTNKNIIPQIAFVGFRTLKGEFRKSGYVATDGNKAFYAKTKKQVIINFNKQ